MKNFIVERNTLNAYEFGNLSEKITGFSFQFSVLF